MILTTKAVNQLVVLQTDWGCLCCSAKEPQIPTSSKLIYQGNKNLLPFQCCGCCYCLISKFWKLKIKSSIGCELPHFYINLLTREKDTPLTADPRVEIFNTCHLVKSNRIYVVIIDTCTVSCCSCHHYRIFHWVWNNFLYLPKRFLINV